MLFSTGNNIFPKTSGATKYRAQYSYNHQLPRLASEIFFVSWA